MLNAIWLFLLAAGVVVAAITGQFAGINQAALTAARSAVMDVALPLCGAMTLWLGIVRLAEKAGLIHHFARLIRPILVRLFSDVPPDHPAMGSIVMNMAANMLGVSNAATPLGLRAMSQLNELNTKGGVATNAMCTFLAINTSSIQLVPATAVNILAINGSKNPTGIVGSTLIATFFATLSAIVAVKLLQRVGPFRWENQIAVPTSKLAPTPTQSDEAPTQPRPAARWAPWAEAALCLLFITVFVPNAFPYWFRGVPTAGLSGAIATFFNALSPLAIPFLLIFFPLYAAGRGIPVYSEFIEGAKEGFVITVRLIPYLVGMLVAIAVFRDSGALNLIQKLLSPLLNWIHFPSDLVPMVLVRPLSGSGSTAVLSDLVKNLGPDNTVSYMAATIYGSAETTFYVVAVYFGSVGVTKTRHAIPAGLCADLVGVIASVLACRLLFR
ncbi:MAG TPA: nucleoside recognition domain-containing protein [Chthoniobacterales bacterium]|jgi:spore maturation protein SpmA|nr:nucleoside recognition domain-containing protein [Chthoniobacterales bacterium]